MEEDGGGWRRMEEEDGGGWRMERGWIEVNANSLQKEKTKSLVSTTTFSICTPNIATKGP
jgi:hypothetical protein